MPFKIVLNDITKMKVDAIVNAANESLLGGDGVDGAIHNTAGPELLKECRTLHGCHTGEAKITKGYKLPSKYVIHTVGPIWNGGINDEEHKLNSCYQNSLLLADEYKCSSIAFPLISAGVYGYPKDKALKVAINSIRTFLKDHEIDVYLVIYDQLSFQIDKNTFNKISQYIEDKYEGDELFTSINTGKLPDDEFYRRSFLSRSKFLKVQSKETAEADLSHIVHEIDESFSQMLLRKIDEKKMTDSECYKKANIDRKLFSKIRSNIHYNPSKQTAIAFAIALELSLDETKELLMKAGYALSHSNEFDIIIEYFIKNHNYNIYEINEVLFAFDQNLLGS